MKNKKCLLLYLCATLLVVIGIAACSSGSAPATEAPTAAPTAAPVTEAPTAAASQAITTSGSATTTTVATESSAEASAEIARPSNPGDPGPAIDLTGDVTAGEKVYVDNCQKCHGPQGTGGVENPGSDDGTIPELNPIDATMVSSDPKVFATNIDLFIEHGSKPEGDNPKEVMAAWGDDMKLTPQQIADVIAYIMSLNTK